MRHHRGSRRSANEAKTGGSPGITAAPGLILPTSWTASHAQCPCGSAVADLIVDEDRRLGNGPEPIQGNVEDLRVRFQATHLAGVLEQQATVRGDELVDHMPGWLDAAGGQSRGPSPLARSPGRS
jgi:hypothetical protein